MNSGYVGLFAVSFLAATLFPMGSEAAVAAMAAPGFHHAAIFLVATLGNVLGALVNYGAGRYGRRFLFSRWIQLRPGRLARAEAFFAKYGSPVLFLSWVPVIGDPLTVAAGVLRVPMGRFTFWVTFGKALRYLLIITGTSAVTM